MEPLVPGQTLAGRFELRQFLGRGGVGEVWLAEDRERGPVALKVVTGDGVPGARAAAQRARRLVHPGIVRTLALEEEGPRLLIALEYVAGDTLAALRGAGYRDIVAAALDVADALQYAHAQGVIHRDLKPANVLRDRQGRCRVTDFGTALTGGGSLSGASPAQLDGEAPTAADDVYGLGALLYDLLTGQPPLHPGITPDRIRLEVPAPVGVDGRGEAVPAALRQLVAAMLEKTPARRPAGMGAVRVILADVLASDRAAVRLPAGPSAPALPPVPSAATPGRTGGPGPWVLGSLVILLMAATAVIFYLPKVVQERGPLVTAPAEVPGALPGTGANNAPSDGAQPEATPRARADQALAAWRQEESAATGAGLERWAAAPVAAARQQSASADQRYRNRDYAGAAEAWTAAAKSLASLRASAAAVRDRALAAGQAALDAGQQALALAEFRRALAVDPEHPPARTGLARAERLDQVLAALATARNRENAGDLAGAAAAFQAALDLDGEQATAREGLARVQGREAASRFEELAARGLGALNGGRPAEARPWLEQARRLRPGDPAVLEGLRQVDLAERGMQLAGLAAEAERRAAAEDWAGAADRYRQLLAADGTLEKARAGLARAEARADLDRRLAGALADAGRFYEEPVARRAAAVLAEARAVPAPGPRLAAQVADLDRQLTAAARTVEVRFESDNLTAVTILKVGALGSFQARTLALRPGTYTVVGTRDGYRDVRRTVQVGPEGTAAPVVVRCEEAI